MSNHHPRPDDPLRPGPDYALLNNDPMQPTNGMTAAPAPVRGRIEVTPAAIATLAGQAIAQTYGVVGLASRHSRPGLAELLRRDEQHKGVEVAFADERVVIDLYVILEYGTRISEVAYQLMSAVKFAVESALEMPVVEVNVNVQGIRVSK